MKKLFLAAVLIPTAFSAQNYVIIQNGTGNFLSNQSNNNININTYNNNIIYKNVNVSPIQTQSINIVNTGLKVPNVSITPAKRNYIQSVNTQGKTKHINTIVKKPTKPSNSKPQITHSNTAIKNPQAPVLKLNKNVFPLQNDLQININVNDNNISNNENNTIQLAPQAVVTNGPGEQIAVVAKPKVTESNSSEGLSISMPKLKLGGKSKVSASGHHIKKHTLKKILVKLNRKLAAKKGNKKKHFILDKCMEWIK